MRISEILDDFATALKTKKAAEIAWLGAADSTQRATARQTWLDAIGQAETIGLRLLSEPALSLADILIKARALRWHSPSGVSIANPIELGGEEPPPPDTPFPVVALHFIARDLLALAV